MPGRQNLGSEEPNHTELPLATESEQSNNTPSTSNTEHQGSSSIPQNGRGDQWSNNALMEAVETSKANVKSFSEEVNLMDEEVNLKAKKLEDLQKDLWLMQKILLLERQISEAVSGILLPADDADDMLWKLERFEMVDDWKQQKKQLSRELSRQEPRRLVEREGTYSW